MILSLEEQERFLEFVEFLAAQPELLDLADGPELAAFEQVLRSLWESQERPGLQPHQLPPINKDWYLWLFLGGRGTGKSQAMAIDFNDHMMGPPCDTSVPGGHRGAVIGPTAGDIATSCFRGPAGLQRLNPGTRLKNIDGSPHIIFPNGALAKCVGGDVPNSDDRLRAHGNTSHPAGTMIETETGPVPIEDVRIGDRVWTRIGLRTVLASGQTGIKPVMAVETEGGRRVCLTADHELWVEDKGWVEAQDLNPGDNLLTWNTQAANSGTSDQTDITRSDSVTPQSSDTGSCTSSTMASSAQACTSTTSTTTRATTASATSKLSQWPSITNDILALRNGTQQAAKPPTLKPSMSRPHASRAATPSPPNRTTPPAFARLDVATATTQPHKPAVRTQSSNASCAELCSQGGESKPTKARLAPDPVRLVTHTPSAPQPVFDLTIDGCHEFIADGVLSHNCRIWIEEAAAIRWLSKIWDQINLSMRLGPDPRVTASTTPRPRLALRRMIEAEGTQVTKATMFDNAYLSDAFKQRMIERFEGTRTYKQEVLGQMLQDTPGALWTTEEVDARRISRSELHQQCPRRSDETFPQWVRRALKLTTVYVALDPATSGKGDRTGIVVVGGTNPKAHTDGKRLCYILEDHTAVMVPSLVDFGDDSGDKSLPVNIKGWSEEASRIAGEWEANAIVVEKNRLGRTARAVIRAAGYASRIIDISATASKPNRADPVRAAWPTRIMILGSLPGVEEEMTTWIPAEGDDPDLVTLDEDNPDAFSGSPDALDAAVHGCRKILGIGDDPPMQEGFAPGKFLEAGWSS